MKFTFFVLFFFLFLFNFFGQTIDSKKSSKNNIYLDTSSSIFFSQISINYEHILYDGKKVSWYGRLGVGKTKLLFDDTKKNKNGTKNKNDSNTDFLCGVTLLTGKSNNHFELDLGTYIGQYNGSSIIPIIDLGYRYQKPIKGINFKLKIGSLGIGIGLGYNF
ncbi:hypothetical protein [Aquimarina longa]|uniref:hypothetical protein n=1 Tax=Aquimarina longa TaxID=1080221 RepID=UPI0007813EA1|nr:hypothetical protein [Aquimarina longa]